MVVWDRRDADCSPRSLAEQEPGDIYTAHRRARFSCTPRLRWDYSPSAEKHWRVTMAPTIYAGAKRLPVQSARHPRQRPAQRRPDRAHGRDTDACPMAERISSASGSA